MPRADVTVEFDQGERNGLGSYLSTRHIVENVDVEFTSKFCAVHNRSLFAGVDCDLCAAQNRGLAEQVAHEVWNDRENRLSCERLDHDHECSCHLGHECDDSCPERQRALREAEKAGGEGNPNPFMVLAAEAPSKEMLGVFRRLGKLEEENSALKAVLRSVVDALPEKSREALGSLEILERTEGAASH